MKYKSPCATIPRPPRGPRKLLAQPQSVSPDLTNLTFLTHSTFVAALLRCASFAALFLALNPLASSAAVQFWDPDGATTGTSVSGNWDTVTSNWTATVDSGANTTWTQGSDAQFNITANYGVTNTEPITAGNITVSGGAGTLTLAATTGNGLTLAGSSALATGGRS